MERDVEPDLVFYPPAHFPDFLGAVIQRRNNQIDKLQPDLALANDFYRIKDGLQFSPDIVHVEILTEGFQINLNGIDNLDEVQKGLSIDMPAGDNTILDSLFARLDGRVIHILKENNGFSIGVGNRRAVVLERVSDNILGRQVKGLDLFGAHLRDLPVLTELAVDIAPGCGDGEGRGVR